MGARHRAGQAAHRQIGSVALAAIGIALLKASACIAALPGIGWQGLDVEWREAQHARQSGRVSTSLLVDNDSYLPGHHDAFYSSGVRLRRAYRLDGVDGVDGGATFGWRLGQDLYTASDVKLPPEAVYAPDHPYAGWLYGGLFRERDDAAGRRLALGIDVGCLGPCAGGATTQNGLHRLLHQPLAQGWSRQVRNEPGLVLRAAITAAPWHLADSFRLEPSIAVRLGNIATDLAGSLSLRSGQRSEWAAMATPASAHWQAWLRLQARAVGYDASLQGGYFTQDNPHTVRPKRLVGEAEVGLQWQQGRWQVGVSVVRIGNEIADLSTAQGSQNIARLQLTVAD